jgi:anti-anti-sigma factor
MNTSTILEQKHFSGNFGRKQVMVIQPNSSKFDHAAAAELLQAVRTCLSANSLVDRENSATLVIDMQKVDFLDSNGLSSLLEVLKTAIASGSSLVLCSLQAPVKLVLEITKMDRTFPIFENYDDFVSHVDATAELLAAYKGDRLLVNV